MVMEHHDAISRNGREIAVGLESASKWVAEKVPGGEEGAAALGSSAAHWRLNAGASAVGAGRGVVASSGSTIASSLNRK